MDDANAVAKTVANTNCCSCDNAGVCKLPVNLDLNPPDVSRQVVGTYNDTIASFAVNLIGAVDVPFAYNLPDKVHLNVPTSLVNLGVLVNKKDVATGVVTLDVGKRVVWVAFRGIHTNNEWNDLQTGFEKYDMNTGQPSFSSAVGSVFNAKSRQKKVKPLSAAYSGDGNAFVYRRFSELYNHVRPQLLAILAPNVTSFDTIVFCGHSTGAALAAIASLDVDVATVPVLTYVFGSPRVGDEYFAKALDDGKSYYRSVNESDEVNFMPGAVMPNYGSHNDVYLMAHAGIVHRFNENRQSYRLNHQLSLYVQNLLGQNP